MKRAVIFDFGGVLMKTQDYRPRHAWDEQLNLPHGSVERVVHGSDSWRLAQQGQLPVENYWQNVAAQLKLAPETLNQLKLDYFSGDMLDNSLVNYIHELRGRAHRIALLSNDSVELLPRLRQLKIDSLFDPLLVSAEIGYMKPAQEAYQTMLNHLQLPAEQTIFIDDMPANIAGARAVGMHTVLYQPTQSINDLRQTLESLLVQG